MPNWMTRLLKFIRDLPSRASLTWPWPFRTLRKANISAVERDLFERYGENVIAMQVSGSFDQNVEHARDWLTERTRSRQRREQITFALEIVVVLLIGGEILLGLWQGHLQSLNFNEQQQVLTNLQNSSAATAKTLTSLQSATESMNTTLQMQLDAAKKSAAQAERSAKAGEASAATASKALNVSERAYVHMTPYLVKPLAAGEKIQCLVGITNSGRTPAIEMVVSFVFAPVSASTSIQDAYNIAHAFQLDTQKLSVMTLSPAQPAETRADGSAPLTQPQVDEITEGKTLIYLFATASYKDVLNQAHHTEICGFYQPASKSFGNCHEHNKSD